MINLMIVDDEIMTVNIIRAQFDWKAMGVDNVYTANSYRQACALFQKYEIHILLCDIEMPQKSGLDLLEWVRDNRMDVVSVFLTGHDRFEYCKRALELGGLEYVLKPAKFSVLEKAILHAVAKVREQRKEQQSIRHGKSWDSNAAEIQGLFWARVLSESIPPTEKALRAEARRYDVILPETARYALVWVRNWFDPSQSRGWDKSSLQYAIARIMSELAGETTVRAVTLPEQSISAFIVEESNGLDADGLRYCCENLVSHCKEYLSLKIDVMMGDFVCPWDLSAQMARLQAASRDTAGISGKILVLDRSRIKASLSPIPAEKWKGFLRCGQFSLLQSDVRSYFQSQLDDDPDGVAADALFRVLRELVLLIQTDLESKGVPTQWITEEQGALYHRAFRSFQACREYAEWLIGRTPFYLRETLVQGDMVEKAKRYINAHVGDDLSRDVIAREIGVNAEYLSRMFKKKEERSLVEYIQEKKMERAASLLQTNQSVSEVAVQLGYHNFAYFTQLFKKHTGQTPSAFKKQLGLPTED